jgi:hypothetical protein
VDILEKTVDQAMGSRQQRIFAFAFSPPPYANALNLVISYSDHVKIEFR